MSDANRRDVDGSALAEIDRVLRAAFPPARPPHLDEEAIITVCRGEPRSGAVERHLRECSECRRRAALARQLLGVDGLESAGRSRARLDRLLPRLEAALLAERRPSSLRIRLDRSGEVVAMAQRLDLLYRRGAPLALRRREGRPTPSNPHFRRRFGAWDVSLEIGPADGHTDHGGDSPGFELLVTTAAAFSADADGSPPAGGTEALVARPVLALLQGDRELAVEPAPDGPAGFRNLSPGRYVLEVREGRLAVGRVVIELEVTGS